MSLRFDRVLYLDFEYACWDGPTPPGMQSEVIQVGVVEADTLALEIKRMARLYVRPMRSEVSEFCTQLTGITPQKLKAEGRPYGEALAGVVKKYGPRSKVCYTWGSDAPAFREAEWWAESRLEPTPFPHRIDLGVQFRIERGMDRSVSLLEALTLMGHKTDGRAHDAQIDAMNVAALHLILMEQRRYGTRVTVFKHELDCSGLRGFPVGYDGCTCASIRATSLQQQG